MLLHPARLLLVCCLVFAGPALAAKKKPAKKPPKTPPRLQQAQAKRPGVLNELGVARIELTKASLAVQRLLKETAESGDQITNQELVSLRLARENELIARKHLDKLMERLRDKLNREHEGYQAVQARLVQLRTRQIALRDSDAPEASERLSIIKQIDDAEQELAAIEEEAIAESVVIQVARKALDEAEVVVESELKLIHDRRRAASAKNPQIKQAADRVAAARQAVIEKERELAEIDEVIKAFRENTMVDLSDVKPTSEKDKNKKNNKNDKKK